MTDAADEAGGEVIFSSDTPTTFRQPPKLPIQPKATDEALELEAVPVEQAFERFAGRLYAVPGFAPKNSDITETPLQRLGRLKKELEEVEASLSADDDDAEVNAVLANVKQRLEQVRLYSQQEWSQKIQQTKDMSAKTAKVELLAPPQPPSSDLLKRVEQMETMVGSTGGENKSLSDRLTELEAKAKTLDEEQIETLGKKAKVIRQDLEAASKARNKLMSLSRAEDTKSITELYDEMVQLQGMTTHLPALAERLKVLAQQHTDSSTWAQRLSTTEEIATQLQSQMTNIEASLGKLEESIKENAETLAENMKLLDEKLGT